MTIFAQYHNVNGSLSIIDEEAEPSPNHTAVQWEEAGPQGPIGPQGPPGVIGNIYFVYGPIVYIEPGEHATVEAVADDTGHDFAIAGGFNNEAGVFVDTSQPGSRFAGNAWSVSATNTETDRARFAQAFALCVTLPNTSAIPLIQR
jgi:hypothetical protein